MESENKHHWCGDCEKGWVKLDAYKKHFTLEAVRAGGGSGGKLIPNKCLNSQGKSPIDMARERGHSEIVEILKPFENSAKRGEADESTV